ncbi:LuxR family transcriptional regulator [Rhizobium sp. WW_1]|uniref:helix-turn-helix transcriptional regulator n=1 Tax=Rhizobium sp. WW_1 TaxID=1907375 RepID=UPI00068C974A|nr:LuxR family transcriptional regulator [Rhizobium sp. WW_1]
MDTEILQHLVTISDAIYAASDRDMLFQALASGIRALGFDSFHLSSRKNDRVSLVMEPVAATFPDQFLRDYERLHWADVDPITERVFTDRKRFMWNIQDHNYPEIRRRSFVDFMRSLGMSGWMVLPSSHCDGSVSGMALLSLNPQQLGRDQQLAAVVVANAALTKAEMLGLSQGISADEAAALRLLSLQQVEILKWMAEGKSNSVIAVITGHTERTVRYHVSEILRKFGVATRQQAIAIFQSSAGLII